MSAQSFDELVDSMTEEVWRNMRRAVETGRWPDGRPVEPGQRELCLEAIITWEARHLPEDQRTGYMPPRECDSHEGEQAVTLRQPGEGGGNDA